MWLAACLWAKKGVEMGRGGGRIPFSEQRLHDGEKWGLSKMLGNSGAFGGPGRWEHSWGSPPAGAGEWVGVMRW